MTKVTNAPKATVPWASNTPAPIADKTDEDAPQVTLERNPFLPPLPEPEPEVVVNVAPAETPEWVDFVRFCTKYAKQIVQARYPSPRGECIDTILKGITVIDHPEAMVRHVTAGWVTWAQANEDIA